MIRPQHHTVLKTIPKPIKGQVTARRPGRSILLLEFQKRAGGRDLSRDVKTGTQELAKRQRHA
jgi:hypothetical protein